MAVPLAALTVLTPGPLTAAPAKALLWPEPSSCVTLTLTGRPMRAVAGALSASGLLVQLKFVSA